MYQEICNCGKKKNLTKETIDEIIEKTKSDHTHYTLKQTYERVLDNINKMS
jgi:hypothetical protein